MFHHLCSQCYAAQHSYVPLLKLKEIHKCINRFFQFLLLRKSFFYSQNVFCGDQIALQFLVLILCELYCYYLLGKFWLCNVPSEYLLAWQEYIKEASKRRVTYTASGYCLTSAFVGTHADIPTEMTRSRQETLGRNILNLSQAWRERVP